VARSEVVWPRPVMGLGLAISVNRICPATALMILVEGREEARCRCRCRCNVRLMSHRTSSARWKGGSTPKEDSTCFSTTPGESIPFDQSFNSHRIHITVTAVGSRLVLRELRSERVTTRRAGVCVCVISASASPSASASASAPHVQPRADNLTLGYSLEDGQTRSKRTSYPVCISKPHTS
jgi:hypothetical protein